MKFFLHFCLELNDVSKALLACVQVDAIAGLHYVENSSTKHVSYLLIPMLMDNNFPLIQTSGFLVLVFGTQLLHKSTNQ